jgi:hypothetical protein
VAENNQFRARRAAKLSRGGARPFPFRHFPPFASFNVYNDSLPSRQAKTLVEKNHPREIAGARGAKARRRPEKRRRAFKSV